MSGRWLISADTGGTFTDCIGTDPDGNTHHVKVLSSSCLRTSISSTQPHPFRPETLWNLPSNFFKGYHAVLNNHDIGPIENDFHIDSKSFSQPDAPTSRPVSTPANPTPAPPITLEIRSPEEAPILAVRILTRTRLDEPLPALELRLGTTRGTNALLEHKLAPTDLFVTRGFADLCRIGDQKRPDLFVLNAPLPPMLYQHVFEIDGRIDPSGKETEPLQLPSLPSSSERKNYSECVAAISLINSYANPEHEQRLAEHLRQLGYQQVCISSDISPTLHYYNRTQTCLVNTSLGPILNQYLNGVQTPLAASPSAPNPHLSPNGLHSPAPSKQEEGFPNPSHKNPPHSPPIPHLPSSISVKPSSISHLPSPQSSQQPLHIMTSSGGLVSRLRFRPVDSLLSGPAGGIGGAIATARSAGWSQMISFDMGGTSTDVSRWKGKSPLQSTHTVGGARLVAPALKIETVAAGGGSICGYNPLTGFYVGPESAGAQPGPACYGAGGPLTITDVHLLLGRLRPDRWNIPLNTTAAQQAFDAICHAAGNTDKAAVLQGFLDIANERMAATIRTISVREGEDPANYGMVAFGGAGGLHACALADLLGISGIIIPEAAGLLSAKGISLARPEQIVTRQILQPLTQFNPQLATTIEDMQQEAFRLLSSDGVPSANIHCPGAQLEIRLRGQESALTVDWSHNPQTNPADSFITQFVSIFGYTPDASRLELLSIRVLAQGPETTLQKEDFHETNTTTTSAKPRSYITRETLRPGDSITGPAVILDPFSTTVIEPNWKAICGSQNSLLLTRSVQSDRSVESDQPDRSNSYEIFACRCTALVEEMGVQLQRTALSPNIRERLDFSCALLDNDARLLVNAPHIPVHLGALGLCVREVLKVLQPGPDDIIILNHPAYGGSHLPDITVLAALCDEQGKRIGFIANRAHHAEIGGIRPGSMPPDATCLEQEGVVIPPLRIVENGTYHPERLRSLLKNATYPSRNPDENIADIQAQIAATRRGRELFDELRQTYTIPQITGFWDEMRHKAASAFAHTLATFPEQPHFGTAIFDDDTRIEIQLQHINGRLKIDFSGTSLTHPGNLNATPAIVQSVLLYVIRLWVGEDLPLNEGLLEAVDLHLPRCFLNPAFNTNPALCPAVVGGNVETSQRLADALISALGLAAESQGTMNNFLFGNNRFGYYETIGGGAGATSDRPGTSGRHVHMTNTAITDPEVLEHRFPVRLRHFGLRPNSGGKGKQAGGDGLIREWEFLEPLEVSILSQRRKQGPSGIHGGGDGQPGHQTWIHANGKTTQLPASARCSVLPNDRIHMQTPGGGAWGT